MLNTYKTKDNFENTQDNAGVSAELCTSKEKAKDVTRQLEFPVNSIQKCPRITLVVHWLDTILSVKKTTSKGKKGKVDPVHTTKAYRDGRGLTPLIFNLSTRWKFQ